jgi:hypothetical protein
MPVGVYLSQKMLNHVLNNITYTSPAQTWIALYTDDPTQDDIGTEITGYTRWAAGWTATSGSFQFVDSDAQATFTGLTGSPIITHWAARDAATVGNLLFYESFLLPLIPEEGGTLIVPAAAFTVGVF